MPHGGICGAFCRGALTAAEINRAGGVGIGYSMLRVFLDLEMNMVEQKNTELRAVLPHEIIEIGAVKLDEACHVVDRFRCYVRPRYNNTVYWSVAKLTGITTAQLRRADYLEEVLPRFVEWVGDRESVRLYAWSDSDRAQWERECTYKNLWTPQLRAVCAHWTDFQRVFSRMLGYRNGLALSRAIEYMGLAFDGTKHDALSDAENCARLMALVLDEAEFSRRKALAPPEPAPVRRPRRTEAGSSPTSGKKASQPSSKQAAEPAAASDAPEVPATPKKKTRRAGRRHHKAAQAKKAGNAAARSATAAFAAAEAAADASRPAER